MPDDATAMAREEQDRGRVMALSEAMNACQKIHDEARFADAVPESERRALRTGVLACKIHLNAMQGEILKRYPIAWTATFPAEFLADRATLAPAAPVEGMVERYKAALDQISDVCNQSLPGIDLALNIRGIIATLDKPQGVGDNG